MSTVTTYLNLVKPTTVEQFSLATVNNNMDLIDTHLKDIVQKMAKGIIALDKVTAFNGSFAGVLTVINKFASVSLKANRKYRIGWHAEYGVDDVSNISEISIQKCLTTDPAAQTTGLTMIDRHTTSKASSTVATQFFNFETYYVPTADETIQIKFLGLRTGGTLGNMTIYSAADRPVHYFVEDCGYQF